MGQYGANPHTSEHIDSLKAELDRVTDPERRGMVLYALVRQLERRPGRRDEAHQYLDLLSELFPTSPDILFEVWRAAVNRSPDKKLAALERLSAVLSDPADIVHCHLQRVQLLGEQLGDAEGAAAALRAASELAPGARELAWARALALSPEAPAAPISEVADRTTDPVLEAALRLELAALDLAAGDTGADLEASLSQVLACPRLDWSLLDGVLRIAEAAGLFEIAAGALEQLSAYAIREWRGAPAAVRDGDGDVASAPPPEAAGGPGEGMAGSVFTGFDVGPGPAAAYLFYLSMIREQRLGDIEGALGCIAEARRLLPDNPLLLFQECLVSAHAGDAAGALEKLNRVDAPQEMRALLALASGRRSEALASATASRGQPAGRFGEALLEAATDAPPPPPAGAIQQVMLSWLMASPGHPEATAVADRLAATGIDSPFPAVLLEETSREPGDVLAIVRGAPDAAWAKAVKAFLGPRAGRREALLALASDVADPMLKAVLLRVAAALSPPAGAAAEDRGLMVEVDSLEQSAEHPDARFEPTEAGWRAYLGAVAGERQADDEAHRTGLFKQLLVQLFALGDPFAATPLLETLLAETPEDPLALLLGVHLAASQRRWGEAARYLERLGDLDREWAALMRLAVGELHLIATGRAATALSHFILEHQSGSGAGADAAAVYRLLALQQLGDVAAVEHLLTVSDPAEARADNALFADVFEALSDISPDILTLRRLVGTNDDTPCRRIATAVFVPEEGLGEALDAVAGGLEGLCAMRYPGRDDAFGAPDADLLSAAAALLSNRPFSPRDPGLLSDELGWYIDTHAASGEGPAFASMSCRPGESRTPYDDIERAEWMLCAGEIEAELGDPEAALRIVRRAAEIAPSHPGLLMAQARLADAAGRYTDAADAHGRLAGFFDSPEEKTYHLAQAALILFDKLHMPGSARNICQEALRRGKEHAGGNEVVTYIMDACGAPPEPAEIAGRDDPGKRASRAPLDEAPDDAQRAFEAELRGYLKDGNTAAALGLVNQEIAEAPGRVFPHRFKLDILTHEKAWDEALLAANLYFEAATQVEEQRSVVFRAAAIAKDLLGAPEAAIEWFKRLREKGPPYFDAERRIFELACALGRYDEAMDARDRMLRLSAGGALPMDVRLGEAALMWRSGEDPERAQEMLREILAEAPANERAAALLEEIAAQGGAR